MRASLHEKFVMNYLPSIEDMVVLLVFSPLCSQSHQLGGKGPELPIKYLVFWHNTIGRSSSTALS